MELVEIDLCPGRLEEFAEMALDDATTSATSSTASTPEPRSQPQKSTRYIQYHKELVAEKHKWGHHRTGPAIAQVYIDHHQGHDRPSDPASKGTSLTAATSKGFQYFTI